MMYKEFEELTGCEISFEDYTKIVEPMYMATDMNKQDFAKFILPSIRPLAKAYMEAKQKAQQKPVFIWTEDFRGVWATLLDRKINVKTGMITYTVRSLTREEENELDNYLPAETIRSDRKIKINWTE